MIVRCLFKALLFTLTLSASLLALSLDALAQSNLADVIAAGQRETALEMINAGNDVNIVQSDGTSALIYAIHQNDFELTDALINAGANANHENEYGASTMSEAAFVGNADILKELLDHGADVNWSNHEGETALMIVARAGSIAAAELLLAYGADVNMVEGWGGQSALMWAAAQSQPEMLELLLNNGADVNTHGATRLWDRRTLNEPRPKDMNKGGFSPLLYAARQGCTDCITILAAHGADLNATDPDRVSALNMALINQNFETAAALIETGADINQWDLFGRAPLYNALDLHTLPTGGRPDIPSEDTTTGYDIAVILLERGANPDMQLKLRPPYRNAIFDRGSDNVLVNGATPLIRAARAADNESVKLLLAHGARVDLQNTLGHTPLMVVAGIDWAAAPTRGRFKTEIDSIETIKILLAAGADINAVTGDPSKRPASQLENSDRGAGMQPAIRGATNTDNQTALHAAAKIGWNQVAAFLIENGIRQQSVDDAGRTPFDLAMGRYPAAFLQPPPEPITEMAILLQEACQQSDSCVMTDPIDFSNPAEIK